MKFAVLGIVFGSFIRRVLEHFIDRDLAFIFAVPVLACLVATAFFRRPLHKIRPRGSVSLAVLAVMPILAQMFSRQFEAKAVFWALTESTTFLLAALIASGRLHDPWPWLYRWAPTYGALGALYGTLQYLILFDWDRAWMVSSDLRSVGLPVARQVRVFGTSEAPGPFALLLAIALIISVVRITEARGRLQLRLVGCAMTITIALVLTSVRSALVAVIVSIFWLVVKTGSMRLAVAVSGVMTVGYFVITEALAAAAYAESQVFVTRRYDIQGIAADQSFQARIELLKFIPPLMTNPLGQGVPPFDLQTKRIDNGYIDLLVTAGSVAFLAMLVLGTTLISICLTRLTRSSPKNELALAACCLCILAVWFSGNLFGASVGPISGILIGSLLFRVGYRKPLSRLVSHHNPRVAHSIVPNDASHSHPDIPDVGTTG